MVFCSLSLGQAAAQEQTLDAQTAAEAANSRAAMELALHRRAEELSSRKGRPKSLAL